MSALHCAVDKEPSESVQFDRLCKLCTQLFDSKAVWETNSSAAEESDLHHLSICELEKATRDRFNLHHRSHHDIRALEESAAAGCHLCSLIFGQIDLSDLGKMRKDLDEALVPSCRQIGVLLDTSEDFYTFEVQACGSRLSSYFDILGDSDQISSVNQQSWSSIAKLEVRPAECDYTYKKRSASSLNCSDASLMRIAQWMGECLTSHTRCFDTQTVAATRSILPLRLLDVASAPDAAFRPRSWREDPHFQCLHYRNSIDKSIWIEASFSNTISRHL